MLPVVAMTDIIRHQRINDTVLGPLERRALKWLAAHTPSRVTPDVCTAVGVTGAIVVAIGYGLSALAHTRLLSPPSVKRSRGHPARCCWPLRQHQPGGGQGDTGASRLRYQLIDQTAAAPPRVTTGAGTKGRTRLSGRVTVRPMAMPSPAPNITSLTKCRRSCTREAATYEARR